MERKDGDWVEMALCNGFSRVLSIEGRIDRWTDI